MTNYTSYKIIIRLLQLQANPSQQAYDQFNSIVGKHDSQQFADDCAAAGIYY